jgi:hypothetical protein
MLQFAAPAPRQVSFQGRRWWREDSQRQCLPSSQSNEDHERGSGLSPPCETRSPRQHSHWSLPVGPSHGSNLSILTEPHNERAPSYSITFVRGPCLLEFRWGTVLATNNASQTSQNRSGSGRRLRARRHCRHYHGIRSSSYRRKLNESEVVRRQFVIARCDPTTMFDLVEEPFDQIAGSYIYGLKQTGSLRLHLGGILASAPLLGSKGSDPVGNSRDLPAALIPTSTATAVCPQASCHVPPRRSARAAPAGRWYRQPLVSCWSAAA